MTEGLAVVEGHAYVVGLLFGQYLMQCIAKTHNGRRVEPLTIDARCAQKGIVRAIDDRIGVEKNQFCHANDIFKV